MKIKAHVVALAASWQPEGFFLSTMCGAPELSDDVIATWPVEVDFDLPADFNPVACQVAGLEAAKLQALADYQASVAFINERLGKLQALTCDGVSA
jgi:hypothetical protein